MTTRVVIEGLEDRNLLAGVGVTLADGVFVMRSNLKLSLARLATGDELEAPAPGARVGT